MTEKAQDQKVEDQQEPEQPLLTELPSEYEKIFENWFDKAQEKNDPLPKVEIPMISALILAHRSEDDNDTQKELRPIVADAVFRACMDNLAMYNMLQDLIRSHHNKSD